jgi:hypothetical protein
MHTDENGGVDKKGKQMKSTRSYLSIVAACYQKFILVSPVVYYFYKGGNNYIEITPFVIQAIIVAAIIGFMLKGLKWVYVLYFVMQAIHLCLLFLQSGIRIYGYNMLLVVLSGFGMIVRLNMKNEETSHHNKQGHRNNLRKIFIDGYIYDKIYPIIKINRYRGEALLILLSREG